MKKYWRAFTTFVLVVCLIFITNLFAHSQEVTTSDSKIDGVPVVIDGKTLFVIQARVGSFSPEERAKTITNRLDTIAQDNSLSVDSIKTEKRQEAKTTDIILGNRVIITLTEDDAKAARKTEKELADEYQQKIKTSIKQYRKSRQPRTLLFGAIYTLIATIALLIILKIVNKTFPRIYNQLDAWRETYIPALRFQNFEILPANQITNIFIAITRVIRWTIILTLLYIYVPLVLSFFPWTKPLGENIFSYFFVALRFVGEKILAYLPNLFVIALIIFIAHYTIRFFKLVFNEINRRTIAFPGFYPEWAEPTYKLIVFLIVALAAVIAFPYLPGSNSPAFRGVSLFLGILFSLGSTAAVANIVGGIILIYTRAFQIGDRVKIGDAIGDIIEKTLLVTRIRTIKNVVITVPNSTVLSSNVINFSDTIRDINTTPLILHTTITLGYDLPWRKVYETLINAALATQHILPEPAPFVLQTSLDDFYVSYELNAYTDKPTIMARIYSELHQNIQDKCNEVGIEIMSPHYSALRDGNQNTIPEDYLPEDYTAPGFRWQSLDK
jgi:small-conductance mechanosensitive channel